MAIIAKEATTGRASEAGHWYDRSGKPCYEITGANGKLRPVTLRDARKFGYVPGFSAISAMEHKPALERWKIEQALMAAMTLPRKDREDDGAFLERARDDSQEQARKAAERGTAIHIAIQGYFEGAPVASEFLPFVMPALDYLKQRFAVSLTEYVAERSFAHPMGYGGKLDLSHPEVVLDFKCKDFGEDKQAKDLAWPEHCMQLAAYSHGILCPNAVCVNVFVSTRVPGLIRVREWDANEVTTEFQAFECLLRLWQIRRNYFCGWAQQVAA